MANIKEENIVSRFQQTGDIESLFGAIERILDSFDDGSNYRVTMILEKL